jgi:2-polyprenyl-3-methyl-5-hydroxy-6-metoxy-1,4-benzoquinol methylase
MPLKFDLQCRILRVLCARKPLVRQEKTVYFEEGFKSLENYFARLNNKVNFEGKTVLDIGCQLGSACVYMALHGAINVVGFDVDSEAIKFAKAKLADYPQIRDKVSYYLVEDMPPEKFDLVLSKDAFEHYMDPEQFINVMKQYLKPDGLMVIGFSPLWKSPYGAHIRVLTAWPWVHLVFPEAVVVHELKRYTKRATITSYNEVGSGLNKMTLKRFKKIVESNGLEFVYFKTNVPSHNRNSWVLHAFTAFSHIPLLREYFTVNIYSTLKLKAKKV